MTGIVASQSAHAAVSEVGQLITGWWKLLKINLSLIAKIWLCEIIDGSWSAKVYPRENFPFYRIIPKDVLKNLPVFKDEKRSREASPDALHLLVRSVKKHHSWSWRLPDTFVRPTLASINISHMASGKAQENGVAQMMGEIAHGLHDLTNGCREEAENEVGPMQIVKSTNHSCLCWMHWWLPSVCQCSQWQAHHGWWGILKQIYIRFAQTRVGWMRKGFK